MEKEAMEKKEILIPDDIVVEIFLRLPVKSLLRLRWACKYWFDLITRDHGFIKMQLHGQHSTTDYQNINNKSLLLISRTPSDDVVSYSLNCSDVLNNNSSSPPKTVQFDYCNLPAWIDHHTIRAHEEKEHRNFVQFQSGGSCNGLIFLYSSCDICYDHSFLEYEYFLWNPSTRELKKLPPNKSTEHLRYSHQQWSRFQGFGYDHTIDDYKVIDVLILYYLNFDDGEICPEVNTNIYTLGSNSWSTKISTDQLSLRNFALNFFWRRNHCRKNNEGCFLNGALHWITEASIMSFDIAKEEYRQLQPPNYSDREWVSLCC